MNTEPITINTAITQAISNFLKLLVVFGLWQLTTDQFGILMIAVDSSLAVIFLLWQARNQSTSINAPRVPAGTPVTSYNPATGANIGTVTAPVSGVSNVRVTTVDDSPVDVTPQEPPAG